MRVNDSLAHLLFTCTLVPFNLLISCDPVYLHLVVVLPEILGIFGFQEEDDNEYEIQLPIFSTENT